MTDDTYYGRLLRSIRNRAGMTQAEVARRSGVAGYRLSRIETGAAAPATVAEFVAICKTLRVDAATILPQTATGGSRPVPAHLQPVVELLRDVAPEEAPFIERLLTELFALRRLTPLAPSPDTATNRDAHEECDQ